MSLTYKQLMLALERDDEWSMSVYVIDHNPTRIRLWIKNGWIFFEFVGTVKSQMGLIERWLAYRAAMRMIDRVTARRLAAKHA